MYGWAGCERLMNLWGLFFFSVNGSLHYMGCTKLDAGNVCFVIRHTEYNYDEMALLDK